MYREASWFVFDIKKVDTDTCDLMHFRACHPESDTCEKALTLLGNVSSDGRQCLKKTN
jgi:hypothetical protein